MRHPCTACPFTDAAKRTPTRVPMCVTDRGCLCFGVMNRQRAERRGRELEAAE